MRPVPHTERLRLDQLAHRRAHGAAGRPRLRPAGLGYRLRRDAWGGGLATEGCRALLSHAFETVGLDTVWADVRATNEGSRRVLAKLGLDEVDRWDEPLGPVVRLQLARERRPG